ncbi:hypothetical protein QA597_03555 [Marinilabiliaceae bacterium ANBcel2]|nr:hypothetical protein [Marinilabiliaceae bacterium ANBcel2]
MRHTILIISILLLSNIFCPNHASSQIWPFGQRSRQVERATRDLEERRQQAGEANVFNEEQPMGVSHNRERNDHIWSHNTAYNTRLNTGNINLTTPSRFGLSNRYEIRSTVGLSYWIPNIGVKRGLYAGENWIIATNHSIFSTTPGLNYAKNNNHTSIIDTTKSVPSIVGIKNELVISRPFIDNYSCNETSPWMILSAGAGYTHGFSFEDNNLEHIDKHILGSRSEALIAKGGVLAVRLNADIQLNRNLFLSSSIKGFKTINSSDNIGIPVEHKTLLNYFITNNFSIAPGYIISFGDFNNSTPAIFPFIDLSIYFGKKPGVSKDIFKKPSF